MLACFSRSLSIVSMVVCLFVHFYRFGARRAPFEGWRSMHALPAIRLAQSELGVEEPRDQEHSCVSVRTPTKMSVDSLSTSGSRTITRVVVLVFSFARTWSSPINSSVQDTRRVMGRIVNRCSFRKRAAVLVRSLMLTQPAGVFAFVNCTKWVFISPEIDAHLVYPAVRPNRSPARLP